jgi:YD repeat-containing protein
MVFFVGMRKINSFGILLIAISIAFVPKVSWAQSCALVPPAVSCYGTYYPSGLWQDSCCQSCGTTPSPDPCSPGAYCTPGSNVCSECPTGSTCNPGSTQPPGLPGTPVDGVPITKDPIVIATGESLFSSTDFSFNSQGPALSLSRQYRSFSNINGIFGYGWRTDFDTNLSADSSGNVTLFNKKGTEFIFKNYPNSYYVGGTLAPFYYIPFPGNYSSLSTPTGSLYTLVDKNGFVTNYDSTGRITSRKDRNGNTLTFVYNPSVPGGTYIQDANGRRIFLNFDGNGHVISASDPAGKTFQYGYDVNGNLVTVTDPTGAVTNYYYDANHRIIQFTNANGHNRYYQYDAQGRATMNWQDNNVNKVTLDYQANNTTVVTDSLGHSDTYVFNNMGLMISHTDPLGAVTQQTWDGNMNKTSITDARNNVTYFVYDGNGNLLQTVDPLGNSTTMTYTPDFNLISTKTDALGHVTHFFYDNHGNLTSTTDALGNSHSFIYDQSGNIISTTDSRGNSTKFTYDAFDHVIQKTDALGNNVSFTYE